MGLDAKTQKALFKTLETRGWFCEGNFIYAPNRMLWLHRVDPWNGNLFDFHETFSARVEKIIRMKPYHNNPQQHQHVVEDNQSLGSALEELMRATDDIQPAFAADSA